jgi:hypothetical protein
LPLGQLVAIIEAGCDDHSKVRPLAFGDSRQFHWVHSSGHLDISERHRSLFRICEDFEGLRRIGGFDRLKASVSQNIHGEGAHYRLVFDTKTRISRRPPALPIAAIIPALDAAGISSGSKHIDAAKALITFLGSPAISEL